MKVPQKSFGIGDCQWENQWFESPKTMTLALMETHLDGILIISSVPMNLQ